jgi:hypothetical protein
MTEETDTPTTDLRATDYVTRVRDVSGKYSGRATLYKTDGEVTIEGWAEDITSEYWVVSSVGGSVRGIMSVNESMVFAANEDGMVTNYAEVVEVHPANENEAVRQFVRKVAKQRGEL